MKKLLLICPDLRADIEAVTGGVSPILADYIGKPLIDHALDHFVKEGVTHVKILACDHPFEIRNYVGEGTIWGLEIEVKSEPTELSLEEASKRYSSYDEDEIFLLDRLPQAPEQAILKDALSWHQSRKALLPFLAPNLIGVREVTPGVWAGLRSRISETAVIEAPCWIGVSTMVRPNAVIGPDAYIEADCILDTDCSVVSSSIASQTYLGVMTNLENSIAAGKSLYNWKTNSLTHVTDEFLLSRLNFRCAAASCWGERCLAFLVILFTLFVPLLAALCCVFRKMPWRFSHTAVLPSLPQEQSRTVSYSTFPTLPGYLSRWPFLWRIFTGHFVLVGNPPLKPEEALLLKTDFERLWLQISPGVFTAAEAEGCVRPWGSAAQAHSALFAMKPTRKWRSKILVHGLKNILKLPKHQK